MPKKLAELSEIREYQEGMPVEVWINNKGRAILKAFNECGNRCVEIDLEDILDWLSSGSSPFLTKLA